MGLLLFLFLRKSPLSFHRFFFSYPTCAIFDSSNSASSFSLLVFICFLVPRPSFSHNTNTPKSLIVGFSSLLFHSKCHLTFQKGKKSPNEFWFQHFTFNFNFLFVCFFFVSKTTFFSFCLEP